jgi:hypothetical protein
MKSPQTSIVFEVQIAQAWTAGRSQDPRLWVSVSPSTKGGPKLKSTFPSPRKFDRSTLVDALLSRENDPEAIDGRVHRL